ncbi:pilin [Nocardiopsis baichengensis]|uniref:pilin n=1 Tax=Nocardiopsis baichengensis TaxID=280240 RepID=UPI000477A9BB|nr:pilin [Nocardiopsis baichengensis]
MATRGDRQGRSEAARRHEAELRAGTLAFAGGAGAVMAAVALVAMGAEAAWAQGAGPAMESTADIREVIDRLREVIVALASAIGTLFLTVAGIRWLMAGGDPSQVDAAKKSLSGAGIGYGIAVLATVLMAVLDYVVAGPEA